MPELPEVDAIAGVVRRYAVGGSITNIEVLRWNGKYFTTPDGPLFGILKNGAEVADVYRVGKYVAIALTGGGYIVIHNAMTGYFDWEHEPWTFDYVEGKRKKETTSDIRVQFHFKDGKILRFHDSRLFGRMSLRKDLPQVGPELMQTPNGLVGRPIISSAEFYQGLQSSTKEIKVRLMDQDFISGIGNIYSNEACHRSGVKPTVLSNLIGLAESDSLYQSLRYVVDQCFPQVRYDWLKVYRRTSCGTCGNDVKRIEIKNRATFYCGVCQL